MIKNIVIMSGLLLTILGISAAVPRCPMWKEIAPCTCNMSSPTFQPTIRIHCKDMTSYEQVVKILRGHFTPANRVGLNIDNSTLHDLSFRTFKEINATIENLKLNHDILGPLNEETFDGLVKVEYLSLAESNLDKVPEHIFTKMPNIKTLDLGRTQIGYLTESNFKNLTRLKTLVLPGNNMYQMDTNSIPTCVEKLHIGRNSITNLNNTLRNLSNLGWLFVNRNNLTTLENQLPINAPRLKMIHAGENQLQKLPQQLKSYPLLETLFFQNNQITSLDGTLSKSRALIRVGLENNLINTISEDDFAENELLEKLMLGHNHITTLNNSLSNLKKLNFLDLTHNLLTEFSFEDIVGLQELRSMYLSFNKITHLKGPPANLVEWNIKLNELKLDHNHLESLNGAISGMPELQQLNISFNRLKKISPDDLIGLDQLRLLDISHNHLTTLEETSKTFLPRLYELRASHNYLKILEKDFHGLPVLCKADLSSNQIIALGRDLVTKTRCKIEHGIHEGTWDTLRVYLQDNPILCDAALPEIVSAMELNHTKISGVSHCPPLSEQPVTSKPNAFLGYIPETTPELPAVLLPKIPIQLHQDNAPTYNKPSYETLTNQHVQLNQKNNELPYQENVQEPSVDLRINDQYRVSKDETEESAPAKQVSLHRDLVTISLPSVPQNVKNDEVHLHKIQEDEIEEKNQIKRSNTISLEDIIIPSSKSVIQAPVEPAFIDPMEEIVLPSEPTINVPIEPIYIDPVQQEQQLSQLASEIKELKSRIDQLSTQNQMLLSEQLNKSLLTEHTTEFPKEEIEEPGMP